MCCKVWLLNKQCVLTKKLRTSVDLIYLQEYVLVRQVLKNKLHKTFDPVETGPALRGGSGGPDKRLPSPLPKSTAAC